MPRLTMTRRTALAAGVALSLGGHVALARSLTYLVTADGRNVRISIWPAVGRQRGTILFSHGALSAPEKYLRVIVPWTEAGFEVLAPLHVDSTDHPDHAKYGMAESWHARIEDMRALSAFVAAPAFIAAGHSYGALVALTLGGAEATVPTGIKPPLRDPRASCVLALSPPGITPGLITEAGYMTLAVPALIQTGDKDVPYNSTDGRWQPHLAAYDAAPAGDKYLLLLSGVDHYYGGLICEPDKPGPPQETQLAAAIRLSTAFIEAYGAHDQPAKQALASALTQTGPVQLSQK